MSTHLHGSAPLPEAATVTVAAYLSIRLHQLGVEHLFGVPGDFNLTLLDLIAAEGRQAWVGSPNELNAGYAADGYARCRGLGALVTTYGVGELSCINAVAGSYAENVPVVQITGAPTSSRARSGALLHHTLADGDFGRFQRAYNEVTALGEVLTPATAAEQIDRVLTTAITLLRPVYISIPTDVAAAPVQADHLVHALEPASADEQQAAAFRERARRLLAEVADAALVAGHLVQRRHLEGPLRRLAEAGRLPVTTLASAKGVFDEDHELFAGVYCGRLSPTKRAQRVVEHSDAVIMIGTLMTDMLSGLFTQRDTPETTITLGVTRASVGGEVFDAVPMGTALEILTSLVDGKSWDTVDGSTSASEANTVEELARRGTRHSEMLTQDGLWSTLENLLPPAGRLLADIGTSFWGMIGIRFPHDTALVTQPIWNSIGYALPAALGCETADPGRRTILLIGDGAAQMTVQELSTLAARGSNAIVIVINNSGYTIERALQSPGAGYNDIAAWSWGNVLTAMAPGRNVAVARTETATTFHRALTNAFDAPDRMVLIEAVTPVRDIPRQLREFAAEMKTSAGA